MDIPSLPAGEAFTAALCEDTSVPVSAVLATYNRCPYPPDRRDDNPLVWAINSLQAQAGTALREIVVVDDGSTDHTPAVLESYQDTSGVPVRAHRLPEHRGAYAARTAAADAASNRWLLFGDDDCVFAPHAAAGSAYLITVLREQDPLAGAIAVPFYYRALRPRDVYPIGAIGQLDLTTGRFATRLHAWPKEYGADPPRIGPVGLVAPLSVELIGGTALIDAAALRRAGGFRDLSAWATSYSDHLHLSADLTAAGARLYHCPDARLAAAHLKWGAVGRFPLHPDDLATYLPAVGRCFGDLVALAEQPRTRTGCRVPDEVFHPEMIGSFFEFFAGRSLDGAVAWATRIWADFVQDGQVYSLTVTTTPDPTERITAWRTGLARGARSLLATHRPYPTAGDLTQVLDLVCRKVGQPPITW